MSEVSLDHLTKYLQLRKAKKIGMLWVEPSGYFLAPLDIPDAEAWYSTMPISAEALTREINQLWMQIEQAQLPLFKVRSNHNDIRGVQQVLDETA